METRANYALIGGIVLAGVAALIGFILWLGQSEFGRNARIYESVFEGPVQLEEGAAVRYIGIKVGEVIAIGVDRKNPANVRARMRIQRDAPIKADSIAEVELASITGATIVQISAGTPGGTALKTRPGEPYPVIASKRNELFALADDLPTMAIRANETLDKIDLVLSDANLAAFSATLLNAQIASEKLARKGGTLDQASSALTSVTAAANAFDRASSQFGTLSQNTDTHLKTLGTDMSATLAEVKQVAASANATVKQGEAALVAATSIIENDAAGTLTEARLASQELRVLIQRVDRMAREIEQNPQAFVVGDALPYEDK
jgi:phospholipid/cholesterol/gamma-HCH transport system substrate-binding protein